MKLLLSEVAKAAWVYLCSEKARKLEIALLSGLVTELVKVVH